MFEVYSRVGHSCVGQNGCLTIGGAINFLQDCSMFQLETEPVFTDYFRKNNLSMVLAFRQVDYLRFPKFGEKIRVCSWVYDCNPAYGYRNTVLYDEYGKACILSYCIGVFVNADSGRVTHIPRDIAAQIQLEPRLDMDYQPRKIVLPEIEGEKFPVLTVKRYDLDRLNHMNNLRYVTIAREYLPLSCQPSRVRVEYKIPAKYGDILVPKRFSLEKGNYLVTLENETGKLFAAVEFTVL